MIKNLKLKIWIYPKQLKLFTLIKDYLKAPRTRNDVIFELTRFCSAVIFGVIGYGLSKFVLFQYKPFLGVPVVGEILIGCLFFALIYYLVPIAIRASLDYFKQFLKENFLSSIDIFSNITSNIPNISMKRKNAKFPVIKETKNNPIVLDTSSIIDARIFSLIELGFISNNIIVPQFVLDELQLISDSADKLKRERGRRGLKILENIRKIHKDKFTIYPYKKVSNVDKELVYLSKKIKARLATVDYNLNKVASISKVKVLNINTLANSLKSKLVPGDTSLIKIIKGGSGRGQGVGYLDDGTMIVVNKAEKYVGKEVKIVISKAIQTDAGMMFFADIE